MKLMKGLVATALLLGGTPVMADEVWDTNTGTVVYEAEMGPTAVWTYGEKGSAGVIYVPGLAKVYKNRGSYRGYWAKDQSEKACSTLRPGIVGRMTAHWGRFDIKFIDKDFPSRWEASWSYCDGEYESLKVEAKPVLGEAAAPSEKK